MPSPYSTTSPIGVMLLVSSLEHGGAERQVLELFRALDRRRFSPIICSLSDYVPLARQRPEFEGHVVVLHKRWKYDVGTVLRVSRVARARRISIVHGFLFDADMTARVARRMGLIPVAIASERNSDYAFGPFKSGCLRTTRTWFDAMIANSEAGKRFNVDTFGVSPDRVHVIRNGVDTQHFHPVDGERFRTEMGVPVGAPLVGMIASFKRQKRHEDFFRAAKLVLDRVPDAWFTCVGEPLRDNQQGAEDYHREMRHVIDTLGLQGRLVLAGAQADMPRVYSACDVTVLSSSREGTPNALLESMACGVPVVATAAGDNGVIVADGRTGYVVPVGDVDAIACRVNRLLGDPEARRRMGAAARDAIAVEFSTSALARRTEDVYDKAITAARAGSALAEMPRTGEAA